MSASPSGVLFCDVCGESVPTRDVDRGAALRRGKRVVCAHHAAEIAKPPAPASKMLLFFLSTPSLSVGAVLVAVSAFIVALRRPGREDIDGASSRADTEIERLADRFSRSAEDARTAAAAAAVEQTDLASRLEGLLPRLDALALRADSLASRISDVEASIAAVQATSTGAVAAHGADAAALRSELGALRDELAAEREARRRAEAVPLPFEAPSGTTRETEEYRRRLLSTDPATRFSALVELAKSLGSGAATDVAMALSDADPFIRAFAARLLGDFRLRESVPDLVIALRDGDADVRRAGAASLRSIAGSDFGYDPDAAQEGRTMAIRRVEEWFFRSEKPAK